MDFQNLIINRYSCRSYDINKKVSDENINNILNAARLAPSAKNIKPWKFLITKDTSKLDQMVPMCKNQSFIKDASFAVICGSESTTYTMTCGQKAYILDLSIAMSYMCLMATEHKIASCWLGAFYEDQIKTLFNIPENVKLVGILTFGYDKNKNSGIIAKNRNTIDSFTRYETWQF